jgi:hypothetical protein
LQSWLYNLAWFLSMAIKTSEAGDSSRAIWAKFHWVFASATLCEIWLIWCPWRVLSAIFRRRSLVVKQYIGLPLIWFCHTALTMSINSSRSAHMFRNLKGGGGSGLWTLRSIIIALWSDRSRGRNFKCVASQVERKEGLQKIRSIFFRMVCLPY